MDYSIKKQPKPCFHDFKRYEEWILHEKIEKEDCVELHFLCPQCQHEEIKIIPIKKQEMSGGGGSGSSQNKPAQNLQNVAPASEKQTAEVKESTSAQVALAQSMAMSEKAVAQQTETAQKEHAMAHAMSNFVQEQQITAVQAAEIATASQAMNVESAVAEKVAVKEAITANAEIAQQQEQTLTKELPQEIANPEIEAEVERPHLENQHEEEMATQENTVEEAVAQPEIAQQEVADANIEPQKQELAQEHTEIAEQVEAQPSEIAEPAIAAEAEIANAMKEQISDANESAEVASSEEADAVCQDLDTVDSETIADSQEAMAEAEPIDSSIVDNSLDIDDTNSNNNDGEPINQSDIYNVSDALENIDSKEAVEESVNSEEISEAETDNSLLAEADNINESNGDMALDFDALEEMANTPVDESVNMDDLSTEDAAKEIMDNAHEAAHLDGVDLGLADADMSTGVFAESEHPVHMEGFDADMNDANAELVPAMANTDSHPNLAVSGEPVSDSSTSTTLATPSPCGGSFGGGCSGDGGE